MNKNSPLLGFLIAFTTHTPFYAAQQSPEEAELHQAIKESEKSAKVEQMMRELRAAQQEKSPEQVIEMLQRLEKAAKKRKVKKELLKKARALQKNKQKEFSLDELAAVLVEEERDILRFDEEEYLKNQPHDFVVVEEADLE